MKRSRYAVAVHLLFFSGNAILLSRRYQTGWYDGEYSVPAGHLDAGETICQAAVRECLEEVGLHLDARSLEVAHVMHRAGDARPDGTRDSEDERIDFFLVVRAWHGEPANAEPEKCDDLRWCEIEHLPENTVPYLRHVLRCVREGIRYSEFGW